MSLSKQLRRTVMASAVAVLSFGAAPAMAADTGAFGACTGVAGTDCTTALGHASISVTDTLSINEMRALSFGNFAAGTPTAATKVVLNLDGTRTIDAGFLTGLHGADATNAAGNVNSGAQSPGHYTVTGDAEGGATQVYISFATAAGAPIDMCDGPETICDSYYPANNVSLGEGLTLNHFFINQSGSDVYGHYIVNAGNVTAGNSASSTPWKPGTAQGSGHDGGTGGIDIVVGGTLTSDATPVTVGKHTGTFNIMASY